MWSSSSIYFNVIISMNPLSIHVSMCAIYLMKGMNITFRFVSIVSPTQGYFKMRGVLL